MLPLVDVAVAVAVVVVVAVAVVVVVAAVVVVVVVSNKFVCVRWQRFTQQNSVKTFHGKVSFQVCSVTMPALNSNTSSIARRSCTSDIFFMQCMQDPAGPYCTRLECLETHQRTI